MYNDKKSIGFIGLGTMGKPMAHNLINAGYTLYLYNRSPKNIEILASEGGITCASPREVAIHSDIVILCLPDSRAVESVILGKDGILKGFSSGNILIDMSTSQPNSTIILHELLLKNHIQMLDAPISGGLKGAVEGTLSIMVGGNPSVFEICSPVFDVLGKNIYHVGEIGAGHTLKAVNNLLYGTLLVASCEAVSMGVKAGIDPKILIEVISNSSGNNLAINTKFKKKILNRDFLPGFTIDLLHKDMSIALELAQKLGVEMNTSSSAFDSISDGKKAGIAKEDNSAIIKLYEKQLNIHIE